MIYTTYFGNLRNLPEDIVPIAICGWAPSWYTGLQYKKLAPKASFFSKWKETHDNDYYIDCFDKQVLSKLDPVVVVTELTRKAKDKQFALVCYERPEDFCHRRLVADWLNKNGYETKEFVGGAK